MRTKSICKPGSDKDWCEKEDRGNAGDGDDGRVDVGPLIHDELNVVERIEFVDGRSSVDMDSSQRDRTHKGRECKRLQRYTDVGRRKIDQPVGNRGDTQKQDVAKQVVVISLDLREVRSSVFCCITFFLILGHGKAGFE